MNIKLNINIFLFVILFFITNQIEIYALTMIFALIHELAHLISGILLGFKPETLKVMPMGFSIIFENKIQDYNKKIGKSNILSLKKLLVALAGPIANLIIAVYGIIVNMDNKIIYSNILILLLNLIPIYPLDGGRIIKYSLKILIGNKCTYKFIHILSNVFIIVLTMIFSILILVYKNIAILLILAVLWGFVIKENDRYKVYNKIYKIIDKTDKYL